MIRSHLYCLCHMIGSNLHFYVTFYYTCIVMAHDWITPVLFKSHNYITAVLLHYNYITPVLLGHITVSYLNCYITNVTKITPVLLYHITISHLYCYVTKLYHANALTCYQNRTRTTGNLFDDSFWSTTSAVDRRRRQYPVCLPTFLLSNLSALK